MGIEIERKYVVKPGFRAFVSNSEKIVQGYLSSVPERNVRVRIKGNKAFLTVKGIGKNKNTTRFEWEIEIEKYDAEELLKICEKPILEKTRYLVPEETGLVFEVDVFHGENEGLVICEIELPAENYNFKKPDWLGKEVTGVKRYYNSTLVKHPFKTWDKH